MITGPFSVSVILPVFNGETFIAEAIDSVLRQGYEPLEIIVIDDGSTDRTAEVVREYGDRVRYRLQINAGPAAARNNGLGVATGDVLSFIDADDIWPEGKLASQLGRFQLDPTLEAVIGRVQFSIMQQTPDGKTVFVPFRTPVLGANLGAGIYRRNVFEKLGHFDQTYRFCEDVDLFLRIREQGIPMVVMDAVTLIYRIHNSNMVREREERDVTFLKALKHSLDRRRSAHDRKSVSLSAIQKESKGDQ
jgi:glycosyltransferase involved in cell wall biosynthesis